jgi:uracil-DNA glycosylase family 4
LIRSSGWTISFKEKTLQTEDKDRKIRELLGDVRTHLEQCREMGIETIPAGVPLPEYTAGEMPADAVRAAVAESPLAYRAGPPAPTGPGLEDIGASVRACVKCKLHPLRKNAVPGEGNPRARLMFVGEAPGADEDIQGRPFVGKAGQLLTKMIEAMGLKREDVFIANILKCRPPGNREPQPDEITACVPYLAAQIQAINPEMIVALGRHAANTLIGSDEKMGALRGRFHEYKGRELMATFHPSYLLRSPGEKKKAWEDLKMVMSRLGITPPEKDNVSKDNGN